MLRWRRRPREQFSCIYSVTWEPGLIFDKLKKMYFIQFFAVNFQQECTNCFFRMGKKIMSKIVRPLYFVHWSTTGNEFVSWFLHLRRTTFVFCKYKIRVAKSLLLFHKRTRTHTHLCKHRQAPIRVVKETQYSFMSRGRGTTRRNFTILDWCAAPVICFVKYVYHRRI